MKLVLALVGGALGYVLLDLPGALFLGAVGAFVAWSMEARARSLAEQRRGTAPAQATPVPRPATAAGLTSAQADPPDPVAALERRVAALEHALADLRQRAGLPAVDAAPVAGATPARAESVDEAAPPAGPPALDAAPPATGATAAIDSEPAQPASPPASGATAATIDAAPARPATPAPATPGWFARLVEGNLVAKVGAVVLFFGVGFLLRFAYDRGLMPPGVRMAGVAAGALALLATGWRLRVSHRAYALVLQGAAFGLAYLDVYFAMHAFGVIGVLPAFGLFAALGIAATVFAVRQDAQALAALGLAGAFLAPVLAATGEADHVLLFSYYALLNLGVLAVSWLRAWQALNLTGWFFTYGAALVWGAGHYRAGLFATVEPFVVLFFAIYLAVPLLFALRQPPRLRGWVDGTLVFGTPAATAVMQAELVADVPYGLAWSAAAAALIYALMALGVWRRPALRLLGEVYVALAVGLATLAVFFAFGAYTTFAIWTLEGAAIVWVGLRQRRRLAWTFGLAVQALGAWMFMRDYPDYLRIEPVMNDAVAGCTLVTAGALVSARLLERHAATAGRGAGALAVLALVAGVAAWLLGIADVVYHALPRVERPGGFGLILAASLVAAELAGTWLAWRSLRAVAAVHALLLVPLVLLQTMRSAHPLADLGILAWPAGFAVLYWALWRQERADAAALRGLRHAIGLYLLVFLAAWGLDAWAGQAGYGRAWRSAAPGLPCAAALIVAPWMERAGRWPLAGNARRYALALIPLAALTVVWVAAANLHAPGSVRPLPYVPLVNPLDAVTAFALVALARWGRTDLARALLGAYRGAVLGSLAFLWVNAIALRSIHFWTGVEYRLAPMFDSVLVQATLSLLWSATALGLMIVAARRARRGPWRVGAALLVAVVLKLFLVDLDGSGTVARIVSFLGVGVLLLVVGYLAPVPPARRPQAAPAEGEPPVSEPAPRSTPDKGIV